MISIGSFIDFMDFFLRCNNRCVASGFLSRFKKISMSGFYDILYNFVYESSEFMKKL